MIAGNLRALSGTTRESGVRASVSSGDALRVHSRRTRRHDGRHDGGRRGEHQDTNDARLARLLLWESQRGVRDTKELGELIIQRVRVYV